MPSKLDPHIVTIEGWLAAQPLWLANIMPWVALRKSL
jgi:hypothetical protein